jgi:hypothetical protein
MASFIFHFISIFILIFVFDSFLARSASLVFCRHRCRYIVRDARDDVVKTFVVHSSDRGPCRRKSSVHFHGLQLASATGMTPADGAATTSFTFSLYSPPYAIKLSLVCMVIAVAES